MAGPRYQTPDLNARCKSTSCWGENWSTVVEGLLQRPRRSGASRPQFNVLVAFFHLHHLAIISAAAF